MSNIPSPFLTFDNFLIKHPWICLKTTHFFDHLTFGRVERALKASYFLSEYFKIINLAVKNLNATGKKVKRLSIAMKSEFYKLIYWLTFHKTRKANNLKFLPNKIHFPTQLSPEIAPLFLGRNA